MITAIVVVEIDDDFIEECELGTADNWTVEGITGWGATIAGETLHTESVREGPIFLGNDGGHQSRHVGTWRAY